MILGEPKVAFLMDKEISFVLTGVRNFLEEDRVSSVKLDISDFLKNGDTKLPPLVIAEAELLMTHGEGRVALYDLCTWQNSAIILVGSPEELHFVKEVTTKSLIKEEFVRPINAKEMTLKIEQLVEKVLKKDDQKKLMIVDDSPTFLRTALQWFSEDFKVSTYPSAAAAIRVIDSQRPDLILLDYEMPACSGAQFLEMLHSDETTRKIPVIFLTSKNDSQTVKEVLSLSPQGYLLKTQPKEEIVSVVKAFFEKEM
ncbi:MAG: response regulator [Lachnospiraceae bacterium]|nr:response regulator [Lachnospiraceae bacterium]